MNSAHRIDGAEIWEVAPSAKGNLGSKGRTILHFQGLAVAGISEILSR